MARERRLRLRCGWGGVGIRVRALVPRPHRIYTGGGVRGGARPRGGAGQRGGAGRAVAVPP